MDAEVEHDIRARVPDRFGIGRFEALRNPTRFAGVPSLVDAGSALESRGCACAAVGIRAQHADGERETRR